ncbi:hypothetical protein D6D13_08508 [Aureobasidium pullulans]|uniref:Uncharacterized protein n=1 Tax=Aureobasidium pullulans TaxID=5580 RepID=A0A4S9C611_AURPU|nr:hypothetical protein D6D13_08508 [Aureobasidium pullulans]
MGDHSATKPIRMYSRWGVAMDMFTLFYLSLFFSRAFKIGALFFFCPSFLSMVLSDASVTKVLSQCVDKEFNPVHGRQVQSRLCTTNGRLDAFCFASPIE